MTLIDDIERQAPSVLLPSKIDSIWPGHQLFEEWLSVRRRFVAERDWKVEEEHDRYDADSRTAHLVSTDSEGKIIAGLRLTPQEALEGTLSWSMLSDDLRNQARQSGRLPEGDYELWDMTRLVTGDSNVSTAMKVRAIAQLFGEGVKLLDSVANRQPVWVFTIDQVFAAFLARNGIKINAVVTGYVGDADDQASTLGYVYPDRLIDEVRATRFGGIAMERRLT